jgi:hypothetical protein
MLTVHPQPSIEEHQRGQAVLLQQRRSDQADRTRLLRPDGLHVDPHSLSNLVGRQILDKDHLEDLAALVRQFLDLAVDLLHHFRPQDLRFQHFFGGQLVLVEVADLLVDHAVPGVARDLVDPSVVDDLVKKAFQLRQGGKVLAAVDDFDERVNRDVLGGREITGDALRVEHKRLEEAVKDLLLGPGLAVLKGY